MNGNDTRYEVHADFVGDGKYLPVSGQYPNREAMRIRARHTLEGRFGPKPKAVRIVRLTSVVIEEIEATP